MKVTGHILKDAIKRAVMMRDTTASLFDGSVHAFEGEDKETPIAVADRFARWDVEVAKLQTAQTQYNMTVMVEVDGNTMTLCEAVKRVGGAGRFEKMWRSVAGVKKDRYSYRDESLTRDPNEIRAKRQISQADALKLANAAARHAATLRAAIAKGNLTEIEMDVTLPE